MSHWSDLYAGELDAIRHHLEAGGGESQDRRVARHATLPGILPDQTGESAASPDLLTEIACAVAQAPALRFADAIVESLELADGDVDSGAHVMAPAWVDLFASLDAPRVADVARRWIAEWDPGAAGDPETAARVGDLVSSIVAVCQAARVDGCAVVYCWTL